MVYRFKKTYIWRFFLATLIATPALLWIADRLFPLPLDHVQITQVVVAKDGTPLWRFADKDGVWRYQISLDEVPPHFIEALLTYEDRHFYQHWGINPLSMLRAAGQWIKNGHIVSGGSTLTMQVARLIEPHHKTIFGKFRQIFRALQLEWHYSKNDILTLYLNRAPYGGTLQGIGAASWAYLGKPPSALLPAESALLAVLPQAPSRLRPDRYPERAQHARNKVLDRLEEYQVWSSSQIKDIRQEDIWLAPRKKPQLAPLLARRLAAHSKNGIIHTTINVTLQQTLEEIARNWQHQLPAKTSLGLLVVDHQTMAVKAYVGSANFNDDSRFGHVDMIEAWRSPGSTLKPFLFGFALDDGLIHSGSLLQDVPRIKSDYRPGNFDTGFHGPVSAADALVRSLNLPFVQLMEIYGPKRFAAKLSQVGLKLRSQANNEPNLSYILGGTAVRMDQLVAAYSAFARSGKAAQLRFLTDDPLTERRLMSAGAAWIVRRILAGDDQPNKQGLVSNIAPFAWKTGTSYGYRDAWAVGLDARYLIGVWVGRPDGTPVAGQYGNATAVPLLSQIHQILARQNDQQNRVLPQDPKPNMVSAKEICWPLGQPLAEGDKNCHRRLRAWILDGMTPQTLQSLDKQDVQSGTRTIWVNQAGLRVAPDCPGAIGKTLAVWPIALEKWLQPKERRAAQMVPADAHCPPIGEEKSAVLQIIGLKSHTVLSPLPGKSQIDVSINSRGGTGERWWFLNGELQAQTQEGEDVTLTLSKRGDYQLLVMDASGQVESVQFRLK